MGTTDCGFLLVERNRALGSVRQNLLRNWKDDRFMQKQGTPLLGVGPVGIGAAEQLELPIEAFYEPGITEQSDEVAFIPEEPIDWI